MNKTIKYIDSQRNKTAAAFSLIEMLIVIGIVAILVALSIPAINAMQKSFNSTGAEGMISTALAAARTLAISNNQYAGVRFQKAGDPNTGDILKADQYMVFIIYDEEKTDLVSGFVAIEGYKPIKLPENVGVIDMFIRTDHRDDQYGPRNENANERRIEDPNLGGSIFESTLTDTSAFSIVFSPAGKLVIRDVRIRNKDGEYRPSGITGAGSSDDQVFNSMENMAVYDTGQFTQDDYAHFGLGGEQSRNKFVIYNRDKFSKLTTSQQRYDYLKALDVRYINAYTGEIIKN